MEDFPMEHSRPPTRCPHPAHGGEDPREIGPHPGPWLFAFSQNSSGIPSGYVKIAIENGNL